MDRTHFRRVIAEKSDLELIPVYFKRADYNPLFVEELQSAVPERPDLQEAIRHAESFAGLGQQERIARAETFYETKHPRPPQLTDEEERLLEIIENSPNKHFLAPEKHPVLWSLNGCGTRFIGRYNRCGSVYDTTRWITFLWIPLIPIDAYRVTETASSLCETEYLIHEKIEKDAAQVAKGMLPLVSVLLLVLLLFLADIG